MQVTSSVHFYFFDNTNDHLVTSVNYTEQAARDRVSKLQSKLDAEERKDDREEYEDRPEDIVRSLKVEEFLADNGARNCC